MGAATFHQQLQSVGRGLDDKSHLGTSIGEQAHNGGIVVGNKQLGRR
jgi:hypothetical protein